MFPTLAVRWVQLRISLWFAQQQAMGNAPLEVPDFAELLNQIWLHMPWEPTLPAHFYNTRNTTPLATIAPPSSQGIGGTSTPGGATNP
jgi:hypothetical protein